jgi:hypothetical protein
VGIPSLSEKSYRRAAYLDQMLRAGNRAKDLVQQILTFSRKRNLIKMAYESFEGIACEPLPRGKERILFVDGEFSIRPNQ